MTGGIGFSRDSSNAQKKNRGLLGLRKTNAENPYWGAKNHGRKGLGSFTELKQWKQFRASKLRSRTIMIFVMLSLLTILVFLIF